MWQVDVDSVHRRRHLDLARGLRGCRVLRLLQRSSWPGGPMQGCRTARCRDLLAPDHRKRLAHSRPTDRRSCRTGGWVRRKRSEAPAASPQRARLTCRPAMAIARRRRRRSRPRQLDRAHWLRSHRRRALRHGAAEAERGSNGQRSGKSVTPKGRRVVHGSWGGAIEAGSVGGDEDKGGSLQPIGVGLGVCHGFRCISRTIFTMS